MSLWTDEPSFLKYEGIGLAKRLQAGMNEVASTAGSNKPLPRLLAPSIPREH